jgi:hypothetical protein
MKYRKGILLALSFLFLFAGVFRELNPYDEGLSVYSAARVGSGEVPYRDFWAGYTPGEFYTLAALFKTFGYSILVERIWDTLIRWALSLVVYGIARRVSSPLLAILPWAATVLILGSCGGYGYPAFPALLFSLTSSLFLMNFLSGQRRFWLTLSGVCIGLAGIYRHEFGFFTWLATGSVLTLFAIAKQQNPLKLHLIFTGGILIPVAPVFLYFVNVVPLADLWSDLVVYPAVIYRKARYLPGPAFFPVSMAPGFLFRIWAQYYTPLAVYALACVVILRRYLRGRSMRWKVLLLALLGVLFCLLGSVRVDFIHLIPATLAALTLLAALLFEFRRSIDSMWKWMICALVIAWFSITYFVLPAKSWFTTLRLNWPPPLMSSLERAHYMRVDPELEEAVLFIQDKVPAGESIYVGSTRHDRVIVNDIMFYFLAGRRSATRYHDLEPGVVTTIPVQEEAIQALRMKQTKYVVLYSGFQGSDEPNESARSSGVMLLDNFFHENFRHVRQFGLYEIWLRSDQRLLEFPSASH